MRFYDQIITVQNYKSINNMGMFGDQTLVNIQNMWIFLKNYYKDIHK